MKAIFFGNQTSDLFNKVYSPQVQEKLKKDLDFSPEIIKYDMMEANRKNLTDVDFIFTTWGMPSCTEEEIKSYFPSLKAVFYAAGSVQGFAKPFLNCGVQVFSAWAANAVPVAEYAAAQIILANKGYFQASRIHNPESYPIAHVHSDGQPGNYGGKIGIIGVGMIGALVINLLKAYNLQILVFDPFLSDERAAGFGVTKCSLETLFTECQTISNHLANNEQTKKMLNYNLFSKTKKNFTFINTGRGAQIVEADLIKALKEEPNRTAILDVTDPEPPVNGHEFYSMENVILTPHIAGSMNDEVVRMSEYMYDEFRAVVENRQTKYQVTLKMLETMA